MIKKFLFLLIFSFPLFLFAQSVFSECENVFTRVEHIPSLKISNDAFQDSLSAELKSKNFSLDDNEVTYKFIVTDKSKIFELQNVSGNVDKEKILRTAILKFSSLWKPATQNGREVCSYVQLKIEFANKKIKIDITQ